MSYIIRTATAADSHFARIIKDWYVESSKERGTGIATRTEEYLTQKILNGDAIVALDVSQIIGFCYIETFENKTYVSNSGLIIKKSYRGKGISSKVKKHVFNLARNKYPAAKIFGITTSDIVMSINSNLGYRPVGFQKLTSDDAFWNGCSSCPNYDILIRNKKKMCLCTAMLAPSKNEIENPKKLNNDQSQK